MQSRKCAGCARMRGCAGNWHSPGETTDVRKLGVSPGEIECAEDSGYIRPETVVESLAAADLAFSGPAHFGDLDWI